jgi:hypothetical protein
LHLVGNDIGIGQRRAAIGNGIRFGKVTQGQAS